MNAGGMRSTQRSAWGMASLDMTAGRAPIALMDRIVAHGSLLAENIGDKNDITAAVTEGDLTAAVLSLSAALRRLQIIKTPPTMKHIPTGQNNSGRRATLWRQLLSPLILNMPRVLPTLRARLPTTSSPGAVTETSEARSQKLPGWVAK